MSPQFIKSRRRGRIAQDYCADMFRSWNLTVQNVKDGYHPAFDMRVFGNLHGNYLDFRAEIKWDLKSKETGNLYVDINSLSKSTASILCICLNDPIDTVLMLPLKDALNYAKSHANITGGEFKETSCLVNKEDFIANLQPKILTTK